MAKPLMPEMRMPGMPGDPMNMNSIRVGDNQVLILWSPWGLEGVFDDGDKAIAHWREVSKLAAYRGEPFTREIRTINE